MPELALMLVWLVASNELSNVFVIVFLVIPGCYTMISALSSYVTGIVIQLGYYGSSAVFGI